MGVFPLKAYLGVTMIPRLCNIIIRRPYLAESVLTP